jgi:hypothetical protein
MIGKNDPKADRVSLTGTIGKLEQPESWSDLKVRNGRMTAMIPAQVNWWIIAFCTNRRRKVLQYFYN